MEEIIKLILTAVLMTFIFLIMKGYFEVMRAERKGAKWMAYPKRKPKKSGEEKSVRLLVSLDNGNVLIDAYDFEEKSFSYPGVEAWRYIPSSYRMQQKIIRSVIDTVRGRK